MQQIAKVTTVFVYLVQAGQENSIPDLDKIQETKGFFPSLSGMFKEMFVDDDEHVDIIFIGTEGLLKEHYRFQEATGSIGCATPEANYVSHATMVELDDLHWTSGDWVFLLTHHDGAWSIKGGNYLP